MEVAYNSSQYLLEDHARTLFPLSTTRYLVENHTETLRDYIYGSVLNREDESAFLQQQRCHAPKSGFHLRRTVKLDPIAEFFVYDVVFRNRTTFRPDHQEQRVSYGYRFRNGRPQSLATEHQNFSAAIRAAQFQFEYCLSVDVATYFNSLYHHDIVECVGRLGWSEGDVAGIGQFLREINSGRSIDCLPHGLHSCKMIGAEFLRIVDNCFRLRSTLLLRFQDDIHLFSDDHADLVHDLYLIQELLGAKGLSLNSEKTFIGSCDSVETNPDLDELHRSLLLIRGFLLNASGDEDEEEPYHAELSEEQVEHLLDRLAGEHLSEQDAELCLLLLRDHTDDVLGRLQDVLRRYPALTKSVYNYARYADNRDGLDELIHIFLKDNFLIPEHQLLWLAKLAEDFLFDSPRYGNILLTAYTHPQSTVLSRSKVLEIPEHRFGLPELREEILQSGQSNWEAWAAASGARNDVVAHRNHLLGYFANASRLNSIIADCIRAT